MTCPFDAPSAAAGLGKFYVTGGGPVPWNEAAAVPPARGG